MLNSFLTHTEKNQMASTMSKFQQQRCATKACAKETVKQGVDLWNQRENMPVIPGTTFENYLFFSCPGEKYT